MRRLLITICYDGANYHGWQIQHNAHTVQAELQRALCEIFGARPDINGCSRTDAGVHALDFAVSFSVESTIACERLIYALNAHLPRDIAVKTCREVPQDFHARYSCLGKRYQYRILNSPLRSPFEENRALLYPHRLDAQRLDTLAQQFVGQHDFAAYCSSGSKCGESGNTVRTVSEAGVTREGDMIIFRVAADGFLYNMVRIMVGTLLDISSGKLPQDSIARSLQSRQRSDAGHTAPPHALYLEEVFYNLD